MVKIYLCGPGGSGKTTLAEDLLKHKPFNDYQRIDEIARKVMQEQQINGAALKRLSQNANKFRNFQKDILLAQYKAEVDMERKCSDFISDRSILDCLAYSIWICSEGETKNMKIEIQKFQTDHEIKKAITRYQKSLFVIVHPWSNERSKEDGTRYPMENTDAVTFISILKELLHYFKISFLDLTDNDCKERINVLKEAIKFGKIKRENSTLSFYQEMSSKPKRGKNNTAPLKKKVEYGEVIVSFYLPYNKNDDIRSISISEDHIILSKQSLKFKRGRIFRGIDASDIASISFDKKIPSDQVRKMLSKNIWVAGEVYTFLGCSSGGLKNRKAFLIRGDKKKAEETLLKFGYFNEIKSVSKKMARIGLLFSSVFVTDVEIKLDDIIEGVDIERGQFNFTDGCGGIGENLSALVYQSLPENEKVKSPPNYLPSVYQFRLHGLKGIVVIDPQITAGKMLVRPSMRKFRTEKLTYFSVCDVSRPYKYGHLNRQLIYLLSSRKVPDHIFLELQKELFDLLSNMFIDKEAAITMLHWYEKYEEANFLLQSTDALKLNPTLRKTLKSIEQDYLSKDRKVINEEKSKEKLRIIVKNSRSLYGVADQRNLLEYGTCYVRITINGVPKVITGNVLTGRMPCYLKGDLRILEAVDVPELNHLVDCIVFPTKGERPHADEQAGGDLDGDKFFVTWDHRLIPPSKERSPCYPAASSIREKEPNFEAMVQYFSLQNNSMKMIGLLNNLFESWANLKGADCEECQWIGQFFGRAIDSVKTGEKLRVPTCFLNPPSSSLDGEDSNFVWQIMEKNALDFKKKKNEEIVQIGVTKGLENVSLEYVEYILQDEFSSIPEYEKFIFAWKFSLLVTDQNTTDGVSFMNEHFSRNINFALFSTIEKIEAIDLGMLPSLVMNGLMKSQVLMEEDLSHYNILDTKSNWGIVFYANQSGLEFKDFINRIIYRDSVLIIFQLPDNVCIGVNISQPLHKERTQCIPVGNLSSFLISKGFGYYKEYQPREDLFYDLYDGRFQIYRRRNVANSFLSLSSQQFKQNIRGPETFLLSCDDLQEILSVDLTSYDGNIIRMTGGRRPHPLVRKTPVLALEVFAADKGIPSYPDVLIGNYAEVEDILYDDLDITEEEIDDRDLCKTLLDQLSIINQRKLSLDGVKDTLKHLIKMVSPWNCKITPKIKVEMEELLKNINITTFSWQNGFEILSSLCKLGCVNLGVDLISKILLELTIEEFFDILSDWTLVWYMDPTDFMECLQQLKTLLLSKDDVTPKNRYLIQVVWSSVIEFIDDMVTCKEAWKRNCITQLKLVDNEGVIINQGEKSSEEEKDESNEDITVHVFRSAPLKKEQMLPNIGDYVLLMRAKDFQRCGNIIQSISCIASVCSITKFPISMQLKLVDKETPEILKCNEDTNWIAVLLPDVNIALYNRIIKSSSILNGETSLVLDFACDVLNSETPRLTPSPPQINFDDEEEFNRTQKKAISASFSSIITCIQGPPGCGKTKCAGAILKQSVKMYGGKGVLAVAETNTAVDNMTRKLQAAGVKVVRIAGDLRKISPDLLDTTIEGKLRIQAEKDGKKIDFRTSSGETKLKKNLKERVLNDADVILTTCAGAGEFFLLERKFRFVLVDEATQTKQATLLCALAHKAEQLVLIGDPMQLGPLVKLSTRSQWLQENLMKEASNELLKSLFHKMHEANPEATYLLDTQYRMHPKIAQFSSDNFYGGRVRSDTTAESRKPYWPFGNAPVGFLHVDGEEKRQGTSYANPQEQIIIQEVISAMLTKYDIRKEDITVLALYNGQVRSFRKSLNDIVVSSIDGFQGKENEYILVSTVRSNYNLGHTDDEKRLNVLLTRAKRGLLICGHFPTLTSSELWGKWIDSVPRFNF